MLVTTSLKSRELERLSQVVHNVRRMDVERALGDVLGIAPEPAALAVITESCTFDHEACLLFPDEPADVTDELGNERFDVLRHVPSVVVRERMSARYGIPEDELDISLVHAECTVDGGLRRGVEVFCLPREQATGAMITREHRENNEHHYALKVTDPDGEKLLRLRSVLLNRLAMVPDGGGYNPDHDRAAGGRSVLYFRSPRGGRLELTCAGHFPDAVELHRRSMHEAPRELLELLTGHWKARAVHVAAELGIADLLADGPRPVDALAAAIGAEAAPLDRFLRFLSYLGVLRRHSSTEYALDAVGELLRSDNPFHDLSRIYGAELYQAWDNLLPAVRTGGSAFGHTFGVEHFDYMATRPELAARFDRAMSATTQLITDRISTVYDFSQHTSMLDVGGGNGTLLHAVLRANPDLRGTLGDQPHIVQAAGVAADVADRLDRQAVDFFTEVPAGHDLYVLARVLHDWNDEDSVRILRCCRAACGADATLLLVERVLPEAAGDSLAVPWDMQMLAVTGGRERTAEEYGRLLADAGFALTEVRSLPLDMRLITARPAQ